MICSSEMYVVFFSIHICFFVINWLHIGKNYVIHVYKDIKSVPQKRETDLHNKCKEGDSP